MNNEKEAKESPKMTAQMIVNNLENNTLAWSKESFSLLSGFQSCSKKWSSSNEKT